MVKSLFAMCSSGQAAKKMTVKTSWPQSQLWLRRLWDCHPLERNEGWVSQYYFYYVVRHCITKCMTWDGAPAVRCMYIPLRACLVCCVLVLKHCCCVLFAVPAATHMNRLFLRNSGSSKALLEWLLQYDTHMNYIASFPGLPRFFCSSVSVDNNTRMRKGSEKRGRPGIIHHVSDVRWTQGWT